MSFKFKTNGTGPFYPSENLGISPNYVFVAYAGLKHRVRQPEEAGCPILVKNSMLDSDSGIPLVS